MPQLPSVAVKFDTFALKGGLDLHTPPLELKPGYARDALNWECSISGGYSRIPGYERYDGRPSPTTVAVYATLDAVTLAGLVVGDAINGSVSGATAVVAAIDGTRLVYTKLTGVFTLADTLRKAPATNISAITSVSPLITDQVKLATYQLAASNIYRSDITAVGGAACSGPVLGVFLLGDVLYAFRNNAAGTASTLWKATVGGWTQVTLGHMVGFSAGSGAVPVEGVTSIVKNAVSATLRRLMITSGTFAAGTAAGFMVVDAPVGGTGAFPAAGAFTGGITATIVGPSAPITLLPGGRYEVNVGNAGNGLRAYGADGVNKGFEFDGITYAPITTGMVPDIPLHTVVHKHHLFFSFSSSSQHAGVGTPYLWSPVYGASELAVNQAVTGYLVLPGSTNTAALAILTLDTVSVLYGTGVSSWSLVELNLGVGSVPYAAQALNQSYIYSALGVVSLEAVQAYGNFVGNSLTLRLRQFAQTRRTRVTESLINREKSQYRVYYNDGYALYCTIVNGIFVGALPIQFPNPVTCASNGPAVNGAEASFFGSTNGMVYRMDTGTSFDGAVIDHHVELTFAKQGSDRVRKRYRKAVFEVQGTTYAEFSAGYSLAYGLEDVVTTALGTLTRGAYWDQFTWDQFQWDGRAIAPNQLSLEGSAENISLRIEGSSAFWAAFTINSITIHYTPRRIIR